jgi:hypothetical protein
VLEEDEGYVEEGEDGDDPTGHAEPAPIQKFHATAVGSVLAAGLLGLRDVIEPPKDEHPAIVESWAGEPSDPDILLRLDPDNPADSIVMIRVKKKPESGTTG